MKKINLLIISILSLYLISCGDKDESANSLFSIEVSQDSDKLSINKPLTIKVNSLKNRAIESISYSLQDQKIENPEGLSVFEWDFKGQKVGQHILRTEIQSKGKSYSLQSTLLLLPDKAPKIYSYKILETYPHDIEAFTQGLEFHGDYLYESTGLNGKSSLRKTVLETGEVLEQVNLKTEQFGEGLTIMNNKIYQLTWQNNLGFVYDLETLELERTFTYNQSKEGWGICNDGEYLYKTDGSERIWRLDPDSLNELDYVQAYAHTGRVREINELEWVDGKIYANVWTTTGITIIDPKTGIVEGVVDMRPLVNEVSQHANLDVLNGIAYKGEKNILYVTGKNWDKLFKVEIVER